VNYRINSGVEKEKIETNYPYLMWLHYVYHASAESLHLISCLVYIAANFGFNLSKGVFLRMICNLL